MEHKIIAMHLIPAAVEGHNKGVRWSEIVYLDFINNRVFKKNGKFVPEEEMKDVYEVFKRQRITVPELPSGIADQLIQLKKEVIDGSKSNEAESRHFKPTEEGTRGSTQGSEH